MTRASPRTIPQIRERLHELARLHGIAELHDLADETRRRYHGRRAPVRSRELTPELIDAIRAFEKENPTMSQQAIAERFRTNAGRVSEALFGKRGEE